MKTKRSAIVLLTLIMAFVITSCNNDKLGTPGNIQMNASSQFSGVKSATIATTAGEISLQSAVVEIQNLQIEENSGNDNEGDHQDGNKDDRKESKKDKGNKENDGGDIVLAGPYVLDIAGGTATIDQVEAQPGTYKKVNFDFLAGTENGGNSIVLTGNYTANDGSVIPFELTSTFEANVQLPLVNGISVNSGSTVAVSIVFDVKGWLNGINFENASLSNGKIVVNEEQNGTIYKQFIEAVSKNIEVED